MYQKTTLDNGLRLITANMPHTRSVSICIFIGTGSRYETDAEAGISHFIEHLIFKGTEKRPTAIEISTVIEGTGGTINAGTDKELTVYYCKVAQSHFITALDVLADMLLNSKFEPVEIERERQVIIEEIHMSIDAPSQRVAMLTDELLWYRHPLGRDIAGSPGSVTAITREMILDYLETQYSPSNVTVAIAGNIQNQEVETAVNRALGKWTGRHPNPEYQSFKAQATPKIRIETRETEQVQLCLALPGLSLFHPKRFTLGLLNVILGEGMSSRLFSEIRDNQGLAYSINSRAEHFLDTGSITISAGVERKNLQVAIKAILGELSKLKEEIPASEITKAKEYSKGRLVLRMEDSRSVAGWMGGQEILIGDILSIDQVISIVDAITAGELQQIAEELLVSNQLRLAIVGPVPQDELLEELLEL